MTEKRFTLKHFEDTDWAYDNGKPIYTKEMVDLLNEQHERILTLEKFLIMKNREINNSIILSDEFKELWNGSLKKFVGDVE